MMIPQSEPFPGETLIADGWVYRDLPRMTTDAFEKLWNIVGHDQTRFLTFAKYPDGAVRGQVLISPAGMKRLKFYKEVL
jgi:hypothetical protein